MMVEFQMGRGCEHVVVLVEFEWLVIMVQTVEGLMMVEVVLLVGTGFRGGGSTGRGRLEER